MKQNKPLYETRTIDELTKEGYQRLGEFSAFKDIYAKGENRILYNRHTQELMFKWAFRDGKVHQRDLELQKQRAKIFELDIDIEQMYKAFGIQYEHKHGKGRLVEAHKYAIEQIDLVIKHKARYNLAMSLRDVVNNE